MRKRDLLAPVVFLAVTAAVIALPAERSGWALGGVASFIIAFLTTVAIFGLMSLALNVQWGYAGVFNFGIAAFFMVGAYTAAIFTKEPATSEFVQYIGGFGKALDLLPFLRSDQWLPFIVGTIAAALVCGVLAFLLAIPTLRLREDYLAITTIGVAEVLRRVAIEQRGLVNGARGLVGIPRPLQDFFDPEAYKLVFLVLAVVVLVLVYLAVERAVRSPWGRVLRALREDELATEASGKNVFAFKMQAFVLGAMVMGIGGSLFAFERGALSPDTFSHFFGTFIFWAMVVVGGKGNNKGAILGAYIVWGLWVVTLQLQGYPLPDLLRSRIFYIRDFVLAALIILVLLVRPQGLLPEERRVSLFLGRKAPQPRRAETTEPARPVPTASETERGP